MKVSAGKVDGFVARPDPGIVACLVYGPDAGLVRERGARLVRGVVEDPSDPFRVGEISPASLSDDPARLADEMMAGSLLGGRRVVSLRGAGDGASSAIAGALDLMAGRGRAQADALLVVEADNLPGRSSLRKLFETRDDCAALPCYPDDEEGRHRFARSVLDEAGVSIDPGAMRTLVGMLGEDRLGNRRELEKLVLYAGSGDRLDEDAVLSAVGDNAAASIDDAVFAAADGRVGELDEALDRFWSEGGEPVSLIRAAQRHFQRLHLATSLAEDGRTAEDAMRQLRPPVFWKLQNRFRQQMRCWTSERLEQMLDRLLEAEQILKSTGTPGTAACGRTLMAIAVAQRTHTR